MNDATAQVDTEQVQLFPGAARTDVRRFYVRLGFVDPQVGSAPRAVRRSATAPIL